MTTTDEYNIKVSVPDKSPEDCDHDKTLITIDDGDGGYQRVCVVCNDIETVTLDNVEDD